MKKLLMSVGLFFSMFATTLQAADYGLPSGIQEGNILHCFDWTMSEVKANLENIAKAGYGSVQLSPLQRPDIKVNSPWHDLYRPYDLCFKPSGMGSEQDLKDLCSEAAKYGIKIIVDVVANHVDKTAGYHDPWWDSNGRVRWQGGINYGDRGSITHGQLGDYGDVNSEDSQVIARGKAYVEFLKNCGVKGIRWDAAKHIGLPSEGCNFWSTVTSVPGVWHYGEILDNPGPNRDIIKEYARYMSVTDNQYSNYAARDNGGLPGGYGGAWAVDFGLGKKCVYWAESHDTYANDDWSSNRDQAVIDRAYAAYACRNNETCLYFARPNARGFNNIKVGKGTDAYKSAHIAAVNKFRNTCVGAEDYFSNGNNAISVTRKGKGAVIVMKGSGSVSVPNGGGYCPAGTYKDMVTGNTFTVTVSGQSGNISGNVGSSGIAVLLKDGVGPDPNPDPDPDPDPDPSASYYLLGNIEGSAGWSTTPGTGAAMTASNGKYVARNVKMAAVSGETKCYFNITDKVASSWDDLNMQANRYGSATEGEAITIGTAARVVKYANNVNASGCLSWTVDPGSYDFTFDPSAMTITVTNAGDNPNPNPDPDPGKVRIKGDYNLAYSGDKVNVYYWGGSEKKGWPGVQMATATGSDGKTYKVYKVADGTTNVIFNTNGDANKTLDLTYTGAYIMNDNGATSTAVEFYTGDDPQPAKPVVTISPNGASFSSTQTVTLSVNPSTASIYYTLDGTTPGASSTRYTGAFTLSATTTVKAVGIATDGTVGNMVSATFTKSDNPNPNPDPQPGNNLNTNYYKVNPNNQVGRNRTVNMSFSGQKSTTAMSNWTEADLIAQGVARDVAQAFKGHHEYPVVDSYALYASYDSQNLYLGIQYVYTVWDLYGDGKLPEQAKPYNFDGKFCIAFDLDPNKQFDGYIDGTYPIWMDKSQKGAKFNNGVDAVLMCSTKPGVGTPGFFIPTADGHASYDAAYCKAFTGAYGFADGLLPSIQHVYGQASLDAEPSALTGNEGFADLRSEIDDSAHTFFEYKLPLSMLGITEDYIKNKGIGVMVLDFYGNSPHGGTPYDPAYFDNAKDSYSQDGSSSKEKEDEDVITYAPARIGKVLTTGVENIAVEDSDAPVEYFNLQGVRVENPSNGVFIRVQGGKAIRVILK